MYYKNIKDFERLKDHHEENLFGHIVVLTVLLVIVTALLV